MRTKPIGAPCCHIFIKECKLVNIESCFMPSLVKTRTLHEGLTDAPRAQPFSQQDSLLPSSLNRFGKSS